MSVNINAAAEEEQMIKPVLQFLHQNILNETDL